MTDSTGSGPVANELLGSPRVPDGVSRDARALLERAVAAKGGADRLAHIRTVRTVADVPAGRMTVTIRYPDQYRADFSSGGRVTRTVVWDRDQGWVRDSHGTSPLPKDAADTIQSSMQAESLQLLRAVSRGQVVAEWVGDSEVAGGKVYVVRVSSPAGWEAFALLAADSGDLAGVQYRAAHGVITVMETDFRDVGGVRIAHGSRVLVGGQVRTSAVRSVQLDAEVPDDAFEIERSP